MDELPILSTEDKWQAFAWCAVEEALKGEHAVSFECPPQEYPFVRGYIEKRQVMMVVVAQSSLISPGMKCSLRSLQKWVSDFNRVGQGGLAAAWSALSDRYSRAGPSGSDWSPSKADRSAIEGPSRRVNRTRQPDNSDVF